MVNLGSAGGAATRGGGAGDEDEDDARMEAQPHDEETERTLTPLPPPSPSSFSLRAISCVAFYRLSLTTNCGDMQAAIITSCCV